MQRMSSNVKNYSRYIYARGEMKACEKYTRRIDLLHNPSKRVIRFSIVERETFTSRVSANLRNI